MSVAGLKKQFYKASQLVSEKVGGAEGTKLDDDFKEMEKKVDLTSKAVTEVLTRTIEYLQPNPASRAKLTMLNTMSKIRGQVKNPGYPQSEGLLGESMIRYGKELGEDSNFGDALLDAGESMKRLAEVKDSLDIEVKQNFIDPLQNLCDKDLKEIQHHLKKLEGRRLDFDYKKKRQGKIPDEELRQAMEKFEESKEVAETSMHNLLETDIEQVSQLSALVDAQLDYHRQAVQILDELAEKLKRRMREASSRPKREYKPKPRETYDFGETDQSNGGFSFNPTPKVPASSSFRSDKPSRASVRSICEFPPPPHCMMCDHLPTSLLAPPSVTLLLGPADSSVLSLASGTAQLSLKLNPKLNTPNYYLPPQIWGLCSAGGAGTRHILHEATEMRCSSMRCLKDYPVLVTSTPVWISAPQYPTDEGWGEPQVLGCVVPVGKQGASNGLGPWVCRSVFLLKGYFGVPLWSLGEAGSVAQHCGAGESSWWWSKGTGGLEL
ncbi:endophilin-A2 isoform 2-T2 [Podargus strigoides]